MSEKIGIWEILPDKDYSNLVDKYAPRQKGESVWGIGSVLSGLAFFILFEVGVFYVTQELSNFLVKQSPDQSLIAKQSIIDMLSTSSQALAVSAVLMYMSWLGYMLFTTHKYGIKSFAKEYGLKFKLKDLFWGVTFGVSLLGLSALASWILEQVLGSDSLAGMDNSEALRSQTGIWFIILSIGIGGLLGPFSEELFFRGFIQKGIINTLQTSRISKVSQVFLDYAPVFYQMGLPFKKFFYKIAPALSIILTSTLFGFMHFQGADTFGQWMVVIVTGCVGLALGIIAYKTKRLGISIVAHMSFNITSLILSTIQ